MTEFYQVLLLGLIQGLTEFLPVSSSGHLVIAQHLIGLNKPQLMLDVMLHLGTLLSVLVVFRHDIIGILYAVKQSLIGKPAEQPVHSMYLRLLRLVVIATLPTVVIGLVFERFAESIFGIPMLVGVMFLITGTILWISRHATHTTKLAEDVSTKEALLIGLSQGLAITPGISRSGTTISVALLLGLNRELAARFSFLMAIPAIMGAVVMQLPEATALPMTVWSMVIIGVAVAFISGYIALKILIKVVVAGNLFSFAYYCWAIGVVTLVMLMIDKG